MEWLHGDGKRLLCLVRQVVKILEDDISVEINTSQRQDYIIRVAGVELKRDTCR